MKKGHPKNIIKLGVMTSIFILYSFFMKVQIFANNVEENEKVTDNSNDKVYYEESKDEKIEEKKESNTIKEESNVTNNIDNKKCVANIYIDAYGIKLNNKIVGYVTNEKESDNVLKALEKEYIGKTEVDKNNIKNINTNASINLEKHSIMLGDINSVDDIVNNVINLNDNEEEPLVEVEVIALNNSLIDIDPATKYIKINTLYMGQSKIIDGVSGKKEIIKKDKYINGEYITHEVIDEKTLIDPQEKIVYTGTKNPVPEGIAFLKHPTNGGIITSKFGHRKRGNHKGIDIGVPKGTPISAAYDGVVKYVGYDSLYGNMVIVSHENNLETLYAHASENLAKVGDKVQKGDIIAKVGSTGRSTGPHLHFELRNNGVAIDPSNFIQ